MVNITPAKHQHVSILILSMLTFLTVTVRPAENTQ